MGVGGLGAAVAPDNRTAVAVVNGQVSAWDLTTGRVVAVFTRVGVGTDPYPVAVSPDGRLVAVGGAVANPDNGHLSGVVWVLEWASGTVRHEFRGHEGVVDALAFRPDGPGRSCPAARTPPRSCGT